MEIFKNGRMHSKLYITMKALSRPFLADFEFGGAWQIRLP
jgi:hypothetical protein